MKTDLSAVATTHSPREDGSHLTNDIFKIFYCMWKLFHFDSNHWAFSYEPTDD